MSAVTSDVGQLSASLTAPIKQTGSSPYEDTLPIIIDGGQGHTVRQIDGQLRYLERYEVWRYSAECGRMELIDRADSLPELQVKHAVPDDRVVYWPICADLPMTLIRRSYIAVHHGSVVRV
jgi:hypothetical protein